MLTALQDTCLSHTHFPAKHEHKARISTSEPTQNTTAGLPYTLRPHGFTQITKCRLAVLPAIPPNSLPSHGEKISHYWINEILEKIERKFCNVECLQAVLSLLKLIYGLSKQHIFVFRRYLWTCTVVSQTPWLYKQVGYRGFYFKFIRGHTCIWGKKCYGRSYQKPTFCVLSTRVSTKSQNAGWWYDLP